MMADAMDKTAIKKLDPMDGRSLARLGAVQALYQMEHSGIGVNGVIREFQNYRLGGELDGEAIRDADPDYFEDLVRGVLELQGKVDPFINKHLSKGWTLKRLDATARAILRCAVYELIRRSDVPARVVIDQSVDLANAFFDEGSDEASFINAVLDKAGHEVRPDEF
ncbi:transcription antitermination factor NusB [Aquisalinus luteolus]|uniref:Transcription antitermination protein NusB n=2 Tax=Aquisalinus luteolus TaxID=1566827 RepID=A0A8J3EQL1_9PROT|nr:transcription antitermination factor NusB [Aquisalinus luteolus]GGH95875.1 N utilization substance protein B [Aquisalinus luteolus]